MKTFNYSPIAVIDSGIGGLSLLKLVVNKYPNENYIYLADNEYMPYGNKSTKVIKSRLLELINYLYDTFNVKLVILACNTASASLMKNLDNLPVKVMVLNFESVVGDRDYKILCTKLCAKHYPNLNVYPCNKLASDIEDNFFDRSTLRKKIARILKKADIKENNIILGCTHYELVQDEFKKLYPNKNFILPCKEFVNNLELSKPNQSTLKGDILMISTLATKSYSDKLWKIFKK